MVRLFPVYHYDGCLHEIADLSAQSNDSTDRCVQVRAGVVKGQSEVCALSLSLEIIK